MSRSVVFTVPGEAEAAGSKRAFKNRHTGRIVVTDANKNSRAWKTLVSEFAMMEMRGQAPLEGGVLLLVRFRVRRPKGHYAKRGLSSVGRSMPFPAKRPDVTKLLRGTEDAMTDVGVWRDDAQVVKQVAEKVWAEDGKPGVDIAAVELGECRCTLIGGGAGLAVHVDSCPIHGGSVEQQRLAVTPGR